MDILTVVSLILAFYCVLLFFDFFFKSCAHYPYVKLLDGLGLTVSYFSIKWKTKAFNRLIIKWGNSRPSLLRMWFTIGVYSSLAFFVIVFGILLVNLFGGFSQQNADNSQPLIAPILPGVNLPVSELGYYAFTLFLCSIIHELGHALAAVLEDVGIQEFGCNLYLILPVAYVNLPTDKLSAINVKQQLRIFTAGVWHNIFLSFIGYLIFCSLPSLFSPFYTYNEGVSVINVAKNSPLKDTTKGLFIEDIIVTINDFQIHDETDWFNCLNRRDVLLPAMCITSDFVNTHDESVPLRHLGNGFVECCNSNDHKMFCFEYVNIENNELELPAHVCLNGRNVMEHTTNFCTIAPHNCPIDLYCFRPILPNNTYLFKIGCSSKNVFYLGHPSDLLNTIEVSSYVRKGHLLSRSFPNTITKLIKYIVIISLGLALVNILPIMFMDGEYVFRTLGLILLKTKTSKQHILQIINMIIWISTIVLVINLIYAIFLIL